MISTTDYSFLEKRFNEVPIGSIPEDYKNSPKTNLDELSEFGITCLKNHIPVPLIDDIKNNLQLKIDSLTDLSRPRDLRNTDNNKSNIKIQRLNDEDFNKGEKFFRNITDNIQVKDPILVMPEILKIALDKKIISICASFFNALPKLTYLKLIKNYANKLNRFDTQYFHYDENAIKLLKVFVYLNDVNNNTEGPFCYVRKSHLNAKKNWGKSVRYSDAEVEIMEDKKNIMEVTAKKGDVIVANTVALHRGLKPISKDRNILIINYGMHQDYTFDNKLDKTAKISREIFNKLDSDQKQVASLLEKI